MMFMHVVDEGHVREGDWYAGVSVGWCGKEKERWRNTRDQQMDTMWDGVDGGGGGQVEGGRGGSSFSGACWK